MKTTTLPLTNSMNRFHVRLAFLFISFACFALSPLSRAVDPPPDGGYPNHNTAEGEEALFSLTTGDSNTATGFQALLSNTTGRGNTATGAAALMFNTTGTNNTASGANALLSNTAGGFNTASGVDALLSNTIGNFNTATGLGALLSNTTGNTNTAIGHQALSFNTTGGANTAIGEAALFYNIIGNSNAAVGLGALLNNTTGRGNIAVGLNAGFKLTTGSNNIDIGNNGVTGDSGNIRIGTRPTHKNTFIAGIFGVTVPTGAGVLIDNSGHLGTIVSSARFKEEIKPMHKASEAILALKPVTFRYKHDLDPDRIPQFGLVAEEVEKVNPDLVARDEQGKPYSVRYEAVNAMLLNEFLKEHGKLEKLESTVAKQEVAAAKQDARIAEQQKEIEALTAGLQKVSARLEVVKATPQTASR